MSEPCKHSWIHKDGNKLQCFRCGMIKDRPTELPFIRQHPDINFSFWFTCWNCHKYKGTASFKLGKLEICLCEECMRKLQTIIKESNV